MISGLLNEDRKLIPPSVNLVEDHDEVYQAWKSNAVKNKILLHFDAHIDFEWVADKNPQDILTASSLKEIHSRLADRRGWTVSSAGHRKVHLGNYLHSALKEGMIKKWFWIVPDNFWNSRQSRRMIWQSLHDLYRFRSGPMTSPKKLARSFQTTIFGVETIVTSLEHLPSFNEEVLLNIDVDYLTTSFYAKLPSAEELRTELPWIWPEELVKSLKHKNIVPSMIGIANSINGGFTPVQFKFLGESLRSLFVNGQVPPHYSVLKQAMILRQRGQKGAAQEILSSFVSEGPIEAARHYQLAHLLYEEGRWEHARYEFQESCYLEKDFAGSFGSRALFFEQNQLPFEAYHENQMMRVFMPGSLDAITGEGNYFLSLGKGAEAKKYYQQALEIDPEHLPAISGMISAYLLQKKYQKALEWCEKAFYVHSGDLNLFLLAGRAAFFTGNYDTAKGYFREVLRLGGHLPEIYSYLGQIYHKLGYSQKAAEFWIGALKLTLWAYLHRLRRRFLWI